MSAGHSKTSKKVEIVEPIKDSLPEKHCNTLSVYPWYYVPGKSYLTEKRLATKHDKESKRHRENEEIDNYFRKQNSEVKLFSNWEQNKPLVKYHTNDVKLSSFYIEDEGKRKTDENLFAKSSEKMIDLLQNYHQSSAKYKEIFIDCNFIVKYLVDFMRIYKTIKEKRLFIMSEIKKYLKHCLYSAIRDPLRQVCFLVKEMLNFYKIEIFNIMKLLKPIYKGDFLTEHEQSELEQLSNRGFQIIDMYIQVNDIRNHHFQQMFNEERDRTWQQQKKLWNKEIAVWDNLIVKLLNLNYLLIKDKLERTIEAQKVHFQDRLESFDLLNDYANQVRHDPALQSLLYKDTKQMITK